VSAAALIDELAAAGIRLTRAGDDLRYQTDAGVSIAPHVDVIRQHKPALLALLRLQEETVKAATMATEAFDRQHYDALWHRWHELNQETN
jgi:hypothetical protein